MQNPPSLQDYLPATDQLPIPLIVSTRQQLVNYLSQWWPQVDTRPGSIFGDLVVTPCAVLIAAHVVAEQNMFSDLQLTNIANGIIYNTGFVTAYLSNFGVTAQNGVASSGTMAMVFAVNQTYIFSGETVFNFGSSAFTPNSTVGDPVVISPVGSTLGKYILTPYGNGQFIVYIPVTGPTGASVNDGTQASTNLAQTQLISITAAGDFNPGTAPSSLPALAAQALQLYPAANLISRKGAESFVMQNWPNLLSTAITVTGDTEMIRASQNPLGINQSALDIFIRSQTNYAAGTSVAILTYNPDQRGWVGGLPFPSPPAFFSPTSGIFQASLFNETSGGSVIYSSSNNPKIDNIGVSFSSDEQLGILLADNAPAAFQNAFISPITSVSATGTTLAIEGEYWGNLFQQIPQRTITMQFESLTVINGMTAVVASVSDSTNNVTGRVYFVPDSNPTPLHGIILQSDPGYQALFNGLNLIASLPASTSNPGGIWNPANALGANFTFSFQGKTASFTLGYIYEPLLPTVTAALLSNDNASVNTAVLARSFIPCNVTQFVVNYRYKQGTTVNITAATTAIFNYVNSIVHPNAYEESQVGTIMISNGATGVSSVTKRGTMYPSLASVYVDQNQNQMPVTPVVTTSLAIPSGDLGVGLRNVAYILPAAVIQFNASVY